jgi:hypothetical protein
MLNAFSLPIELLAQVIGCDMFLILTFWRTSKNSSYICFIIFLVLHIFVVSNIVACCDILVDWIDEKYDINAMQTHLMIWTCKE